MATDMIDKAIYVWGWIFRTLTISTIGYISYNLLNTGVNIGDVPFSQLTLNTIIKEVFAIGVVGGCAWWFCNFPKQGFKDEEGPITVWGNFGGGLVLIGFAIFAFLNGRS